MGKGLLAAATILIIILTLCSCHKSTVPTLPQSTESQASTPVVPTQTEQGVVFLSDFAYRDINGYLHVIGEIRNDTTGNVNQVKINVSLLDTGGNITATRANLSYLFLLEPQQRSPFDVIFQVVSDEIPNYQMELSWQTTDETPKTRIQIQQTSAHIDEESYYWVNGEVQNIGSQASDLIVIIGTFYDSAGQVVAMASGFPDIVPLEPGESSSFVLVVEIPEHVTIQGLLVQAEAY